MNNETLNLLKHNLNPLNAFRTVGFLSYKFFKKISLRITKKSIFYPRVIKKIYKQSKKNAQSYYVASDDMDFYPIEIKVNKIKLAVGYLAFDKKISWNQHFDDPEQLVSLHRWGWLLHLLIEAPREIAIPSGLHLMQDWCLSVQEDEKNLIWESYSTGERICNAILFSHLTEVALPNIVRKKIGLMTEYLSERLEYFGSEATGNHVINNARALYFSGLYFKIPSYTQLAKKILAREITIVVNQDGFLREGSSHYHFLITRWLLELAMFAEFNNDKELLIILDPILSKMIECCWFFIVPKGSSRNYVIPLIGDVSPDCTWKWLLDLPWTDLAKKYYKPEAQLPTPDLNGWGQLFGKNISLDNINNNDIQQKFYAYPQTGWYRLNWKDITMIWHIEPMGSPSFASHGHCDTGSFCLYWKGQEILIDPGRFNYNWNDLFSVSGIKAAAHNSVTIDGYDPFIYQGRFRYPRFYRKNNINVNFLEQKNSFYFSVEHTGFSRITGDNILYKRSFVIFDTHIDIQDTFLGSYIHQIKTFFQWSPDIEIIQKPEKLSPLIISRERECIGEFIHHVHVEPILENTWYFPNYGEKTPMKTLLFDTKVLLPYTAKYTVKIPGRINE